MKGRASLPGADELFRDHLDREGPGVPSGQPARPSRTTGNRPSGSRAGASGATKVTFYCTAMVMDLENARASCSAASTASPSTRGRIVREAEAQVLSELERDGADAALVKRLTK